MEPRSDLDRFELVDLEAVIRRCAHDRSAGRLVATSQAIEELRVLSGDFQTSDEEMARVISAVAIRMGCPVVFDEQVGADTLKGI